MKKSPKLSELSALERVYKLPYDAPLTSSEAAFFLRLSLSTLERMRRDGSGPAYLQSGGPGAKGTNQKCRYLRADLEAYLKSTRVTDSMAAAERKGQVSGGARGARAFSSWEALRIKHAFYVSRGHVIQSDVESVSVDEVLEGLGRRRIAWMDTAKAMTTQWLSHDRYDEFSSKVSDSLYEIIGEMADVRRSMLSAAMKEEIARNAVATEQGRSALRITS